MLFRKKNDISIRPAKLEDSETLSQLQKEHVNSNLKILDIAKPPEKFRVSIGQGLLKSQTQNYMVVEEDDAIIGFVEQKRQNNLHAMIGYPYVDLDHPSRKDIQVKLLETILDKLQSYGIKYVSTQISTKLNAGQNLYQSLGFKDPTPIFQAYHGVIKPDYKLADNSDYQYRRVTINDLDMVYSWIKRQLNPLSPIYITKSNFEKLLHAPKERREGWSIAIKDGEPVAMISSIVDKRSNMVIVFGPFNTKKHQEARLPLLNELLLYHNMKGRKYFRLMRIEKFDNDEELISKFNLKKFEEIRILTKKL